MTNGLVLTEENKASLTACYREKKMNVLDAPNFQEALDDLCDQMFLNRGQIAEQGGMTTCFVYYTLSNKNGFYVTQIFGSVVGMREEVICHLMVSQTLPKLKSNNLTYTGRWSPKLQSWEFTNE